MFAIIGSGFILNDFVDFGCLICCDIVLWYLRGAACLVKWFPQFHIASLIIEFVAHSMELAFLIGSICWSVTDGPLLITIALALLLLTNLLLVYRLAAVPYVLLKGSAEQKMALANEACPGDALRLREEEPHHFDIILFSVDCI